MLDRGFIDAMAHLIAELDPLGHAPLVPGIPTRVIQGAWDHIVPPESARELLDALQVPADLISLPRRTHFTVLFDPRTAQSIVEWLDRATFGE